MTLPQPKLRKTLIGSIDFANAKIFIDGNETRNPTLIGLAVLDALEGSVTCSNYKSNKKALEDYIKQNKQRATSERFEILKTIHKINGSFDIETVYGKMKVRGFDVSRATVYNTMNLFLKCAIVHRNMAIIESKKSEYQLL